MTLTANNSDQTFEACFSWNGNEGRIIASYIMLSDGQATVDCDEVCGVASSFLQCRVEQRPPVQELSLLSKAVQEEIQRVLGKTFLIPRGVRLGGVMYIERP